jgi:hypothetical protein
LGHFQSDHICANDLLGLVTCLQMVVQWRDFCSNSGRLERYRQLWLLVMRLILRFIVVDSCCNPTGQVGDFPSIQESADLGH